MIRNVVLLLLSLFYVVTTVSYAQASTPTSPAPAADSFQTVDKHASNLIRVDPHANWAGYRRFRLTSAVYQPSSSRHPLKPDEMRRVQTTVDRSLQKAFQTFTGAEGPVLEVRPVITGVRRTNTFLNVLGFAAIQAPISFGGASIRYELFDTESGERIGVISCERAARPWNVYPWNALYNFQTLGQGSVILKSDSKRLRKDLQRLGRLSATTARDPSLGTE
jgi:hypothetical protein